MSRLVIKKECVKTLLENRFLKVFDLQYEEGAHYYVATRRKKENILSTKSDEEFCKAVADAVTCAIILKIDNREPMLLLNYEYRYPAGRTLLSPTAGLVDPEDLSSDNPLISAATREIFEETGIKLRNSDKIFVVSPLLLSSPGMTDESNALVCAVVNLENTDCLNQNGAVGGEIFEGFRLIDEKDAKVLIEKGSEEDGTFFSAYTWIVISYFLSEAWKNK